MITHLKAVLGHHGGYVALASLSCMLSFTLLNSTQKDNPERKQQRSKQSYKGFVGDSQFI
jgi:hypothetical protein